MTMTTVKSCSKEAYDSNAFPPLHSILILTCLLAVFLYIFPTLEEIDKKATIEVFVNRVFPELISLETLVYTRAAFSLFIFSVSIYSLLPGNG